MSRFAFDPSKRPKTFAADDPGVRPSKPTPVSEARPDDGGQDDNDTDYSEKEAGAERSPFDGAKEGAEDRTDADNRGAVAHEEESVAPIRPIWSLAFTWGGTLVAAVLALVTLSAGVMFARIVSVALASDSVVGFAANGLLIVVAIAALVLAFRELIGLWRLTRLTQLRSDAAFALSRNELTDAQAIVKRLQALQRGRRDRTWGLQRFREREHQMRSGVQLLRLADRVLLKSADAEAKAAVFASARRVAVVTAIVPVTLIVVLFVLFENLRMIHKLARVYGGRTGILGGLRLFWWIVGHLAATGAVALTDDLFGQFVGQDMARRLSRRLGEGAFNGAMTARLGVAAVHLIRPLPFIEAKPLRVGRVLLEVFPEFSPSAWVSGRQQSEAQRTPDDPK
ncbi:MAG: TIGR01620 family protein [Pseudomonadota bacterium]